MKLRAKVKFLGKDQGGRTTAPRSGYKPQIKVGEVSTSCFITTVDNSVEIMDFGITYDVFIELQFEDLYIDKIYIDMPIYLYEGSKLIGIGSFIRNAHVGA